MSKKVYYKAVIDNDKLVINKYENISEPISLNIQETPIEALVEIGKRNWKDIDQLKKDYEKRMEHLLLIKDKIYEKMLEVLNNK